MAKMSISTDNVLRIGIVDLMSGTAGKTATRLFSRMIASAADGVAAPVRVSTLSLPPDGLLRRPADCGLNWRKVGTQDAVIITGAEPRSAEVEADPLFAIVVRLLEAVADRVVSTLFSCFSAHAAIWSLYSAERTALREKLCGVFAHHVSIPDHPLVAGVSAAPAMPHSRWNRISRSLLHAKSVVPLMQLAADDWHLACSSDGLRYVFVQGHPEYERDTILREYRRDVRRFLTGATDRYPVLPTGYFDNGSAVRLAGFQEQATRRRDPATLESFPEHELVIRRQDWHDTARTVTKNWLNAVVNAEKDVPGA